jgi:diguanylate cyclase (GGDEF)-like protein
VLFLFMHNVKTLWVSLRQGLSRGLGLQRVNTIFVLLATVITIVAVSLTSADMRRTRNAFDDSLYQKASEAQRAFDMLQDATLREMQMLAAFIASDTSTQTLFLAGKLALEQSDAPAPHDDPRVQRIRSSLQAHLDASWQTLHRDYGVRQMQFVFHPHAVSFLRLHRPDMYGDSLSGLRHLLTAADASRQTQVGFESGRVSSSLRAVVPVYAEPRSSVLPALAGLTARAIAGNLPDATMNTGNTGNTGNTVNANHHPDNYVGTLGIGMSFAAMLEVFTQNLPYEAAVLLRPDHVDATLAQLGTQAADSDMVDMARSVCGCYLEASSDAGVLGLLTRLGDSRFVDGLHLEHVHLDGRHYAVSSFPLADYHAQHDPNRDPVGTIMLWRDVTSGYLALQQRHRVTIGLAFLGWLGILGVLWWGIRVATQIATHALRQEVSKQTAALRASEQRFRTLASRDALTGLANRHAFFEQGHKRLASARRHHAPLSLMMLDIDHFKQVNDDYGHEQGDNALRHFAHTAQQIVRPEDVFGRIGGEEFAVLLSADIDHSHAVAERLRCAVATSALMIGHTRLPLTVSIGVATLHPDDDLTSLLARADAHVYQAKRRGRNQVVAGHELDAPQDKQAPHIFRRQAAYDLEDVG